MRTIARSLLPLFFFSTMQVVYADFRDNGDGTITDSTTKLTWQKCSAPSEEANCSISPTLYIWDDALAYCNGLGLGGYSWRLPNVKELQTLVDPTKTTDPTIDTVYFPDTQMEYYWSSTTFVDTTGYAWYVNFTIGIAITSPIDKTGYHYVRCVREG